MLTALLKKESEFKQLEMQNAGVAVLIKSALLKLFKILKKPAVNTT
ncbi:hypothetical protein ambt_06275 [Alteromonas naphthalenivorans]|uniref:Uncharacterized protein n=1 Tax=Alteromonas naphthalenivorans TaxID=715451 RepID=F5ZCP3_ALTNA|nr:hypothetical protein ambt_06275 [Alteromonas naphthalenivorans]|tara:strand:+ start:79 stop:216 length:138 start_codon:yes stop_codon:yes gene_type:complete